MVIPTLAPGTLVQPVDLVSDEIRSQLDIILLNFLNTVCSDRELNYQVLSLRGR